MISTDNVLAVFHAATPEEVRAGSEWYEAAHTFALGLSERYGLTFDQAAGVIAAISPRLSWSYNMAYADRLVRTGDAPLLNANKAKALAILAGQPVADVLQCATCSRGDTRKHECSGQKVRAFYACIVHPESDSVCVDRHAYDVAAGQVGDDVSRKALDRVGGYQAVVACYRDAALALGLAAATVQAICWVVWRNQK